MANTLISTGRLANLLARGVVTTSPALESLRPASALYDGDPGIPARYASLAADAKVDVDLDMLQGLGDFEGTFSGNNPPGFVGTVTGTGTIVRDTAVFTKGVAACKLGAGTSPGNDAFITIQREVRAGERIRVRARLTAGANDANRPITVRIKNLRTGRWWNGSAWVAADAIALTWSSDTFSTHAQTQTTFSTESFDACAGPETLLEIRLDVVGHANGAFVAICDELEVLVVPTLLGIAAHNADPSRVFTVEGADEPTFASPTSLSGVGDAPVPRHPSFYVGRWAEQFFRHVRVIAGGTNLERLWYGELFLCDPLVLSRNPDWPIRYGFREPQVRNRNAAGGSFVTLQGRELRTITLPFSYRTDAQYTEARDEILRRSRHGFHPTLFVPDDTEPDVYLARHDGSDWTPGRTHQRRDAPITLEEMALADLSA